MPRMARIVVPGVPHHVTQRGNNRQDVFFVDDDHRVYIGLFAEQSRRFGLSVVCYCLMTNHVHLVVIPKHVDSLAKGIGRTNLCDTRGQARPLTSRPFAAEAAVRSRPTMASGWTSPGGANAFVPPSGSACCRGPRTRRLCGRFVPGHTRGVRSVLTAS